MDVQKVPEKLRHLVPYVERWSAMWDEDILVLLKAADSNPTKMDDARRLGELFTPELQEEFDLWEDLEPMTHSEETSAFYFALVVLDELGLLQVDENWNTVEGHIKVLSKTGSYRLASERMHSAKILANFGNAAQSAIEPLRSACHDEDHRVRVWAHSTLYKIDGQNQIHIQSIREFLQNTDREVITEAASALGQIGTDAASSIPDLIHLIDDPKGDEYSIPIFIEALVAINREDPQVKQAIERAARSMNQWIRSNAEGWLESMKDE